jgi:DMSO/TMAO reductase YedYZ molybdopterin-dependent catalytic subunit
MMPDAPFQRFPLQANELTDRITSTPQLFVLAHLGIPHIDPGTWILQIDGLVDRPMR